MIIKKLKIFPIAFLIFPLFLTGCGEGDVGSQTEYVEKQQSDVEQDKYDDTLEGLQNYLKDMELISGEKTDMLAEIVGAKQGVKYSYRYNKSNVTVELYEFESANEEIADKINNDGAINILGREIPAVISDNKRYLMIYSDKSGNQKNIDMATKIKEVLKTFKNENI